MTHPARLRTLFYLVATVVALILLSTSLSQIDFRPGQPFPFGPLSGSETGVSSVGGVPGLSGNLFSWWAILAALAFGLLIVLWLVVFILRPEVRKYLLGRLISYLLLLLLISGLVYSLQQPLSSLEAEDASNQSQPFLPGELPPEPMPTPPAIVLNPPRWLVAGMTLLLTTLVLGAGWWLWTRRSRRRESPAGQLAIQAREAVQAINSGRDFKDMVMNSYRQMTQILAQEKGVHRARGMTPREFEQHLADAGLGDEHIRRLTRLFESVRYGSNIPSKAEEREAVACLNAVAEEYAHL